MSSSRHRARVVALLVAIATAAAPAAVRAQTDDEKDRAKDLFSAGLDLREKGDEEAALEKFKGAYDLLRSPITTLEYGRSLLLVGQAVEARARLREAASLPEKSTESVQAKAARKEAATLAAGIPTVSVRVNGAVDANVSIDGERVSGDDATPVVPGHHRIGAKRPNGEERVADITVSTGDVRVVVLAFGVGDGARNETPAATTTAGEPSKVWLGLDAQLDVLFVGSGENICKSGHWACTKNGVDVGLQDHSENGQVTQINAAPGGGGKTNGGPTLGTARVWVSADYFVTPNISVGGRLGYAFNGKPTTLAQFFPYHVEARVQYFLGEGPTTKAVGFKPYLMAAGGMAEFDAAVPNIIVAPSDPSLNSDNPAACSAAAAAGDTTGQNCRLTGVKAYRVAGRSFAAVGAGIWWMLSPKIAINLAAKLVVAFPSFSTGVAPELGIKFSL